ncbi:MAG TPA: MarR family winged helix-turn-helix transcriptional regulator [Acidimicrobiales bacterium]|nr:MarR family winged helix-turn-helix transcriptional regulator [Acidimicrobiales bacterium]
MPVEHEHPSYATPGHLVRRTAQIHNRIFEEEFAGTITPRQFAVVVALSRQPAVDQITLSNLVAIDRTTIGGMIQRLTARGYVEHMRDPKDSRRKVLKLSAAGQRFLDKLAPKIDAVSERLLAPLTAQEQRVFLKLLSKVATVDDPHFPDYRPSILEALTATSGPRSRR